MALNTRSPGFTMVEMLVVVALIGVLSLIAIPGYLLFQARARRGEAYANLAAIAHTQTSFFATQGVYHDTGLPFPDFNAYGGLGTNKMPWDADSEAAWGDVGWQPEGRVFYSYQSNVCCADLLCFSASAYGDVDGDGSGAAVMYVEPRLAADGTVLAECPSGLPAPLNFGTPTGPSGPIYHQVAAHGTTDEF